MCHVSCVMCHVSCVMPTQSPLCSSLSLCPCRADSGRSFEEDTTIFKKCPFGPYLQPLPTPLSLSAPTHLHQLCSVMPMAVSPTVAAPHERCKHDLGSWGGGQEHQSLETLKPELPSLAKICSVTALEGISLGRPRHKRGQISPYTLGGLSCEGYRTTAESAEECPTSSIGQESSPAVKDCVFAVTPRWGCLQSPKFSVLRLRSLTQTLTSRQRTAPSYANASDPPSMVGVSWFAPRCSESCADRCTC